MKSIVVSLGVLCVLAVSGCQTVQGLQTQDAALARDILVKHCVVGLMHMGTQSRRQEVREGAHSKRNDGQLLSFRHKIRADEVSIYSVKDLRDGWVAVDASSQGARDNMYFNRETAEFACSTSEWRYARSDSMVRAFEVTPLILRAVGDGAAN